MSRFTNDVDTVGMMLSNTLVQLFAGILSIIGTLLLMIYTNLWLTLVTLVMIPLMMRAGKAVAKRSHRFFSAQQASLGAVNGYVEEMITGQKVVKVFCHEQAAQEEFDLLNRDLRDNQIRAQFFGGIMGPAGMIIGVPTFAVIYRLVAEFVEKRLAARELSTATEDYGDLDYIDEKKKTYIR